MLVAIKLQQPSLLYEAMVLIGAVSPTRDPDEIERALAQFLAADVSSGPPSRTLSPICSHRRTSFG